MSEEDFVWSDMVPDMRAPSRSHHDWDRISKELEVNEGRWGLVLRDVPISVAAAIRSGKVAALRPIGAYEVRVRNSRTVESGKRNRIGNVWVRKRTKAEFKRYQDDLHERANHREE